MLSDLGTLLRQMDATLHRTAVVFCLVPSSVVIPIEAAIAVVREAEGVTLVLAEDEALSRGLEPSFRAEWITLNVHSDLQAVGLTAAVSRALADANISCNVIAGVHHDHIFVPHGDGLRALAVLRQLAAEA